MSIARALSALSDLPLPQLSDITGLDVTFDGPQSGRIVDAVRDAVLYGHRYHAWDNPQDCEAGIHNAADFLVPTDLGQRVGELREIATAWEIDLRPFNDFEAAEWRNTDLPDNAKETAMDVLIGRALYLAYADAVRNVVAWAVDHQTALS